MMLGDLREEARMGEVWGCRRDNEHKRYSGE